MYAFECKLKTIFNHKLENYSEVTFMAIQHDAKFDWFYSSDIVFSAQM